MQTHSCRKVKSFTLIAKLHALSLYFNILNAKVFAAMKSPVLFFIFSFVSLAFNAHSQNQQSYKSWNPVSATFPVLEGQAWPKEVKDAYDRFPARAQQTVEKEVWDLSKNSTGLFIKFTTNATNVQVRYIVTGKLAFPHMPATGVSGTDLYGIDRDGRWFWFPGRYSFGDTISYSFSKLLASGDTT